MNYITFYESPLGRMKICANGQGIYSMQFAGEQDADVATEEQPDCLVSSKEQLNDYYAGKLKQFDLPLHLEGTDFQMNVWRFLLNIPFGEVCTYGVIAKQLVNISAARAVGAACGANPIGVVVPCHRIVSSSGALTGYAGGLWRKKWLLEFEQSGKQGRQTALF